MPDLILHLKYKYFDQVEDGIKLKEYRLVKPYWTKRIVGKTFGRVIIVRGYTSEHLIFPWNGYEIEEILHEEFGKEPVLVYGILLRKDK